MKTEKYFNTTGFCIPTDHYMVDPTRGLMGKIEILIKKKRNYLAIQIKVQQLLDKQAKSLYFSVNIEIWNYLTTYQN